MLTSEKAVCIDETVTFAGHLTLKHILQKAHKYNIKLLKLYMKKGYTWYSLAYCVKEDDDRKSVSIKVALKLYQAVLGCGWTCINYYTSLQLTNKLLNINTHIRKTFQSDSRCNL
jgi:hypothetical protein